MLEGPPLRRTMLPRWCSASCPGARAAARRCQRLSGLAGLGACGQFFVEAVDGRAADVEPVEAACHQAHPVGSLLGEEVFPGLRVVPEPVLVAVPTRFLIALLLPVDATGDHGDDSDDDPNYEDPDSCDESDACHVWRPLTVLTCGNPSRRLRSRWSVRYR